MDHGLELISPILEIFGNVLSTILSYPGNTGNPPAPACQGPSCCEGQGWSHRSEVFCLEISSDLRSASPGLVGSRAPWTINLPPSTPVHSTWGVSAETLKINEISIHIQYTRKSQKWCPKTSQGHQNEVPRGPRSHQNNENVEKVKSNENHSIYYTFERLGHQNSREFLFKNHQKTWLQSRCDFELYKSEKIWKNDAEGSPMGDPKSIKNH